MGKDYFEASAAAREVFQEANAVLKIDLAELCFAGPEERLNQTDISQPAIYTTSVACFRAACEAGLIDPQSIDAYAGLSLGEYTALHLAGVYDFQAGLRLVAARGAYMQQAAEAVASGMVAVLGGQPADIQKLCDDAANGEVLAPANFNAPGQIVVSGTIAACERFSKAAEAAGLRTITLKVAGAFHSALMQSAADKMRAELERVEFHPQKSAVYANVTGKPHGDVSSVKALLVDQVVKPVLWEQTMQTLLAQTDYRLVELAPGRTLTGLAKKINRRVPVESLATADALAGARA